MPSTSCWCVKCFLMVLQFSLNLLKAGNIGHARWGLGEIDGLIVLPGKASNLQTGHLITG